MTLLSTQSRRLPIPVVIAADDNFAVGAGVLMQSVLDHTDSPVRFYFFHDSLSTDNRRRVEQTVAQRPGCALTLIDASESLDRLPAPLRADAYTKMTYARLLAPAFVEEDRAVYLDADTLVRSDVRELYEFNLRGALIAATPDYGAVSLSLRSGFERDYFRRMAPGGAERRYFNAGVMVMDLGALQRERVAERALDLIASGVELRFADQCALNLTIAGRYAPLPERWNTIVAHRHLPRDPLVEPGLRASVAAAFANPAAIHYIGPKPWTAFPTVLKHEFAATLGRSAWRDHRPSVGGLSWRQKRALLKAWRNEAISLRLRTHEVTFQLFGRQVVHWSRPQPIAA